jgi:DNA adenine methylase
MQTTLSNRRIINARPFLKWAGGKTQLLDELIKRLPSEIKENGVIENYVEPFVGGGAMFFCLKNKFEVKQSYLFDINPELVVGYTAIQRSPKALIKKLAAAEADYLGKDDAGREKLFYDVRDDYNRQLSDFDFDKYHKEWVDRTAQLIFLNKTCFNGLFRQNSKGEFNVPFGKYKNPTICNAENLKEVYKALKNTKVMCGDFSSAKPYVEKDTFIYLDPPYRPLNATSSFTGYAKDGFDDNDQKRLAKFFRDMGKRGAFLMLSNSDPKNENPKDNFFEKLYKGFRIEKEQASRMINCNALKRGPINELIIMNYKK